MAKTALVLPPSEHSTSKRSKMRYSTTNSLPRSSNGYLPISPRFSLIFILLGLLNVLPPTTTAATSCLTTPSDPNCEYPVSNAKSDMDMLCKAMPFMSGCSLRYMCVKSQYGGELMTKSYCSSNFDLVASVCYRDPEMKMMKGCDGYNRVCRQGNASSNELSTPVMQCMNEKSIATLPTTSTLSNQVKSICDEMTMDGCEKCVFESGKKYASCDLLSVYGYLCYQMPEMSQCGEWSSLCASNPELGVCKGELLNAVAAVSEIPDATSSAPPVMKMYFFSDMPFYLLFKSWVPRTDMDLVGAWFAIFFLGVFYEGIQVFRSVLEMRWAMQAVNRNVGHHQNNGNVESSSSSSSSSSQSPAAIPGPGKEPSSSTSCQNTCGACGSLTSNKTILNEPTITTPTLTTTLKIDLLRATYQFFTISIAYILMLAVMSFHIAIFFAAVAGMSFGTFFLHRFRAGAGNGLAVGSHREACCC